MKYESLHTHTVISDGQQTHREVLATAEQHGFGLIVFTDHDILPRRHELEQLEEYAGPVQWEVGIEISSGWPVDIGGGPANLFHLLALRIDQNDQRLQEYCQTATEARIERMKRTVKNLRHHGFNLTLKRCLELAGEGAAASPHLVRALLEREENVSRLELLFKEMARTSATDEGIKARYEDLCYRYNEQGVKALPYGLLLSTDAFIPEVYVPYLFYNNFDTSVALIREAGGVAILAHWPAVRTTITEELLAELVSADRLDGLEVRSGFTASQTVEQDEVFLRELCNKHDKLITIGIDSHMEEDFSNFTQNEELARKTVGLWDRVTVRK